eukprot:4802443-Ditylum_brightwellii.AAC.1
MDMNVTLDMIPNTTGRTHTLIRNDSFALLEKRVQCQKKFSSIAIHVCSETYKAAGNDNYNCGQCTLNRLSMD